MSTPELPAPEFTLLRLAEHGERLSALEGSVAAIADQLGKLLDGGLGGREHQPIPAPQWWLLDGDERDAAIARLAAWVEQVYRPSYGTLAAGLAQCWSEHVMVLYTLDWLSELWQVLYLQPRRTASMLAGQAEWQTRLLPAAAEQIVRETSSCGHPRTGRGAR